MKSKEGTLLMGVDGAWQITLALPTGATQSTLHLRTHDGDLAGSFEFAGGLVRFDGGKVDGDTLTWSVELPEEPPLTLRFSAIVEEDKISGDTELGTLGHAPFSGARAIPPSTMSEKGTRHRAVSLGRERTGLVDIEAREPSPKGIAGPTVATLISPGTELAWAERWMAAGHELRPGYAAVFRVTRTGPEVTRFREGDLVFCMGPHASWQVVDELAALPVPRGLAPERAVFARFMAVSMSSLRTTAVRPPASVLVAGLGLVGALAARNFAACGYRVTGCDPSAERRALSTGAGFEVRDAVPEEPGPYELALDCSGHEGAVLACCRTVVEGGEVVLVGVPHKQRTDLSAHALADVVFRRYIHLRGGWEWQIPLHAERLRPASVFGNLSVALDWLAEGRVQVDRLALRAAPDKAAEVYERLGAKGDPLSFWFDWQNGL